MTIAEFIKEKENKFDKAFKGDITQSEDDYNQELHDGIKSFLHQFALELVEKVNKEVKSLKFNSAKEATKQMVGGDIFDGRNGDTVIKDIYNEAIDTVLQKIKEKYE
jgi:hypothetical protein